MFFFFFFFLNIFMIIMIVFVCVLKFRPQFAMLWFLCLGASSEVCFHP